MKPRADEAVIWRGPKKNGLIKQFLKDVNWGDLDYLASACCYLCLAPSLANVTVQVVDTPPGTSDEHLSLAQYLKSTRIDGAVIVTTPQAIK